MMGIVMVAWFRYSKQRLFNVLMVLSLVAAVFGQGATPYLRQVAYLLIAPIGDGGMYLVTSLKFAGGGSPELSSDEVRAVQDENEQLRQQVIKLERDVLVEREDRRRELEAVQRLRAAFDPRDDLPCELIPARVTAADSLPYRDGRVLNVGSSRGAAVGAPVLSRLLMTDRLKEMPPNLAVLTTSALVGRLESAGPFTARLQLLTDPGFILSGKLLRRIDPNRPRLIKVLIKGEAAEEPLTDRNNMAIRALASGDGAGGMVIKGIAEHEKVQPGDWFVTADDDPYLRREVRVGVVDDVRPRADDHSFVQVRVRPFEDLGALRDVYIVYWKPF
jgi:cell shape-determining protein MreC